MATTMAHRSPADRFILITGCSGGGKSTLLVELGRRGFMTIEEPGRRIVREALAGSGDALPWADPVAFAKRAIALSLADLKAAERASGLVFFDRGLVDAAVALAHAEGRPVEDRLTGPQRYHHTVFVAPPWPEIFRGDDERRHGLEAAIAEFDRLCAALPKLGYAHRELPRVSTEERADFVLAALEQ